MTDVKNLAAPAHTVYRTAGSIYGSVEADAIVVRYGSESEHSVEVFRMSYHHKLAGIDADLREHIARQLANAIRDAQRLGFDQGRAFVREALGIDRRG